MATGRNFQWRESIRDIIIYPHIKFWWFRQCWIFAVLWWPFWKCRPVEIFNGGNQFETSLSTHISNFDDIGQCWIFTHLFYAVLWQPFWKWQTSRKFWKRRIAPLMATYHYVKCYVSIIIHLEVININVRNFNFPIGFYSNPHPALHAALKRNSKVDCCFSELALWKSI
jgi:hypothetical protein